MAVRILNNDLFDTSFLMLMMIFDEQNTTLGHLPDTLVDTKVKHFNKLPYMRPVIQQHIPMIQLHPSTSIQEEMSNQPYLISQMKTFLWLTPKDNQSKQALDLQVHRTSANILIRHKSLTRMKNLPSFCLRVLAHELKSRH